MRLVGSVSGNLVGFLDAEANSIADDLRRAIDTAGRELQAELRGQVRSAGLGENLARAWRLETYPRGRRRTFRPAALVYSNATVLHEAFDEGPTITPRRARYLVIPTDDGRRLGLGKVPSARRGGRVPGGRLRSYADLEPWADRVNAEVVAAGRGGRRGGQERRRGGFQRRVVLVPGRRGGTLVALFYRAPGRPPVVVATLVPRVKLRKRLDIAGAAAQADARLAALLDGAGGR
jgi:hypothetical protein